MTEEPIEQVKSARNSKNVLILAVVVVLTVALGAGAYLFVLPMVMGSDEAVTVEPAPTMQAVDPSLDMNQHPELKPDLSALDAPAASEGGDVSQVDDVAPNGEAEIFKPEDAAPAASIDEAQALGGGVPSQAAAPEMQDGSEPSSNAEKSTFDEMAAIKRCGDNFDEKYKAKDLDPLKFPKERGEYLEKCVSFLKEKQPK